jgi:hypothetical protein
MADTNITIVFEGKPQGEGQGTIASPTLPNTAPKAKDPTTPDGDLKSAATVAQAVVSQIPGGSQAMGVANTAMSIGNNIAAGGWAGLAVIAIKLGVQVYKEIKEIKADQRRTKEIQRRSGNAEYYRRVGQ